MVCYTENTDYVVESLRSSELSRQAPGEQRASPGRQRRGLGPSQTSCCWRPPKRKCPGEHALGCYGHYQTATKWDYPRAPWVTGPDVDYSTNSIPAFLPYCKKSDSKQNRTLSSIQEHPFRNGISYLHHERRPEVGSRPHTRKECAPVAVGHSGTGLFVFSESSRASLLLRVLISAPYSTF